MKNVISIIGILVLCLLAWSFFGLGTGGITNYPPKNAKVVAFGDSLVFGKGSTPGNNFVAVLERKVGRPIINLGISGDTTTDGIVRMHEVTGEDPGIVILLLGGNDFLGHVDEATIQQNLSTLIETFQAQGAVVVLLGVRSGLISNNGEEMYEDLSDAYGTVFLPDVLDGIYLKSEFMSDGIHPNDAGYAIIAEYVYDLFTKYKL